MRIRAVWRLAGMAMLLLVCGFLTHPRPANGADPGPAMSRPQEADPPPQSGPARQVSVMLPAMSAAWFLNRTRGLLHDGRAAEAYQIARAALDLFPDKAALWLGAAFAAMRSGRCQSATRHLDVLRGRPLLAWQRLLADTVRAGCQGPWRWQALIGADRRGRRLPAVACQPSARC